MPQADIRLAISFDSPAALAKFAKQKKTDLPSEQHEWLQRAVASRHRPTVPVTINHSCCYNQIVIDASSVLPATPAHLAITAKPACQSTWHE